MKKQKNLVGLARKLRRDMTPAEMILWKHLRGRRFADLKFRRQHPTGRYILDFYCPVRNLVLEIDGETHLGKEMHDKERQRWLEEQGCKVLRFWNTQVYDELESVLEAIWLACQADPSPPTPLPGVPGRGGTACTPLIVVLMAMAVWTLAASAQPPDKKPLPEAEQGEGVSLTIYNQDFVVVRERRLMDLPKGRGSVRFRDVAATIVPETVQFTTLGQADAARVVEQSYEFDVVSADKLLDKYIDRDIAVVTKDGGTLKGKLLSFDNRHLTLATPAGIDLVPRAGNIQDVQFSALPEGLLTRPTLVWLLEGKQAGKQLVKVAYAADKMTWRVDYRARVNQAGDKMDLAGWVTVTNQTGTTFKDAQVKLMAGDLHRVKDRNEIEFFTERIVEAPRNSALAAEPRIVEKSFAEYHLYELTRKTTITDHATKQIELLNIEAIPVSRKYQVPPNVDRVAVLLEFKNSEKTVKDLGIPLPKGPIRVFQAVPPLPGTPGRGAGGEGDGAVEFIGQDSIDHTPKDELVHVRLGYAFNLKAERKTLAERATKEKRYLDQQIKLRNHKAEPVTVEVIEAVEGRHDAEISGNNQPFTRKDVNTLVFNVTVPANGETVITYTVRYTR